MASTTTLTAYAPEVRFERMAGAFHVYDAASGVHLGQADVVRGFAHYYGSKGTVHEGVKAVVVAKADLSGLRDALVQGLRHGRDDRED